MIMIFNNKNIQKKTQKIFEKNLKKTIKYSKKLIINAVKQGQSDCIIKIDNDYQYYKIREYLASKGFTDISKSNHGNVFVDWGVTDDE